MRHNCVICETIELLNVSFLIVLNSLNAQNFQMLINHKIIVNYGLSIDEHPTIFSIDIHTKEWLQNAFGLIRKWKFYWK